jgi:lysyl-tRNA synthetase class 2
MGRQEEIIQERHKRIEELKKLKIDPYPNKYDVKDYSGELQEKYVKLANEKYTKDKVSVAGRIIAFRDMGKIAFGSVQDSKGKIQIVLQEKETPAKVFDFCKNFIDIGDFVGVKGTIFRTKRGELSILVSEVAMLSKSILPLPEKFHGIENEELKLRKRYLDMIMNQDVRQMFVRKSAYWNVIRNFLLEKGFIEVETPILETSAGGAAATPFKTHHNALDMDVYLRISVGELWQKKLMVAGLGKTFEIGRIFRNEGMDAEHLQDYTSMEFYWSYANYEDGMELVKEMYKKVAKEVYGKMKFKRGEHEFDFSKDWKIIDFSSEIKKKTGIDVNKATREQIIRKLNELKEECPADVNRIRGIDLLWKHCRRNISGPAFLTGQLAELTPLAKRDVKHPDKVQQFQVIIAGSEVGNGYSELNDAMDQEKRFIEQRKLKDAGDSEAQEHDEGFVEALKYGMPPVCGFGTSERLFAFLEDKPIRETVIFPLMKPEAEEGK